jgi:hypothetical protein
VGVNNRLAAISIHCYNRICNSINIGRVQEAKGVSTEKLPAGSMEFPVRILHPTDEVAAGSQAVLK